MNNQNEIKFRAPKPQDGTRIWNLVGDSGVLEQNTAYCYLLLATHFSPNGIVAEQAGKLVGFVAAYRPPTDPEAVFVWQIGVDPSVRGRGLGKQLLHHLVGRSGNLDARFLTATVAEDNEPSNRLFRGFAREHNVDIKMEAGFDAELFPPGHAAEPLLRIGPLAVRKASEQF